MRGWQGDVRFCVCVRACLHWFPFPVSSPCSFVCLFASPQGLQNLSSPNPCSLPWKRGVLTPGLPGKSLVSSPCWVTFTLLQGCPLSCLTSLALAVCLPPLWSYSLAFNFNFLLFFSSLRHQVLGAIIAETACDSLLTSMTALLSSARVFHRLFYFFIYLLFMAVLGLCFCARAFSSCGKWGPLFIAVRGPLIIVASLVAKHRLQTRRLSNCGSRA